MILSTKDGGGRRGSLSRGYSKVLGEISDRPIRSHIFTPGWDGAGGGVGGGESHLNLEEMVLLLEKEEGMQSRPNQQMST